MSSQVELTLRAIDEASSTVENVGKNVTTTLDSIETASKQVTLTQEQMNASLKGVVTGFSQVATAGFSLYLGYDRIHDAELSLDKANLQVKSSANSLEDAQRRATATIQKYGEGSEEAKAALADLDIAQQRYQISVERAENVQNNLNNSMVSFGLMIIPTAISAIDGITRLVDNWGNAQKSLHFILEMNPILKVVAVISVLTAAIAWAYQNVDWFREGVDSCFNVLKSAVLGAWSVVEPIFKAISGAIQWIIDLWNSLRAVLGAGVSVPTSPSEGLGSFEEKHEGGPILRTGPYILKAGEYVLPAGRRFGTVINGPLVVIQGSASKSDVEAAADYVVDEIERIDRG